MISLVTLCETDPIVTKILYEDPPNHDEPEFSLRTLISKSYASKPKPKMDRTILQGYLSRGKYE